MLKSAIVGALLLGVQATAHAGPTGREVAIKTSDLNLADPADRAKLNQRIISACGEASDADPASRNAVRACRADASERALRQGMTEVAAAQKGGATDKQ